MLSLAYRRKVFRLGDYSGIFPQPILLKSAFEACDLPHNGPYQGHFLKLKISVQSDAARLLTRI